MDMKIGIDISQIVYEGTGVGTYVRRMVKTLLAIDKKNEYVLFGSSFRQKNKFREFYNSLPHARARLVTVAIPPTVLDILWNRLHVMPVEKIIGQVDIFWSSDWTQPPLIHAKGVTTIHDLIAFKFPEETHARTEFKGTIISANIVAIQKRRLKWVAKECTAIFCDSEATKKDIEEILRIPAKKLHVVYPAI